MTVEKYSDSSGNIVEKERTGMIGEGDDTQKEEKTKNKKGVSLS